MTQFFGGQVQSPLQSLLVLQILIPHKKHPEECAWSDYCNNFGKSERVFSFKAPDLEHEGQTWKKGGKIFWGVQSTQDYPSISK